MIQLSAEEKRLWIHFRDKFLNAGASASVRERELKNIKDKQQLQNILVYLAQQVPDQCLTLLNKTVFAGLFENATELTQITITNNIEKIEEKAFAGSALINLDFEEGVKEIGAEAFANCSNLQQVTLPESVDILYPGCFRNCSSLKSIYLPISVDIIQEGTFVGCPDSLEIYTPWRQRVIRNMKIALPTNTGSDEATKDDQYEWIRARLKSTDGYEDVDINQISNQL